MASVGDMGWVMVHSGTTSMTGNPATGVLAEVFTVTVTDTGVWPSATPRLDEAEMTDPDRPRKLKLVETEHVVVASDTAAASNCRYRGFSARIDAVYISTYVLQRHQKPVLTRTKTRRPMAGTSIPSVPGCANCVLRTLRTSSATVSNSPLSKRRPRTTTWRADWLTVDSTHRKHAMRPNVHPYFARRI